MSKKYLAFTLFINLRFLPFWLMLDMVTECFANRHTEFMGAYIFYTAFWLFTMKVTYNED